MHSFVLDFIMAGLLVAVIVYSVRLSQKIDTLNSIRAEITPMIGNLTTIMNQASANVARLKTLSGDINTSLAQSVPKGEALKDDLIFLVDNGERIAQRLESGIYSGRLQAENARQVEKASPSPDVIKLHPESSTDFDDFLPEEEPKSSPDAIKLNPAEPIIERPSERRWGLLNALKEVR
jgi:Domain of unknown function (DUF6468)